MKKSALLAAVCGAMLVSPMVAADQYVQLQLGQASTDAMDDVCDYVDFIESNFGVAGSCDDKDDGFRISYGYAFNDIFAIEGGYQDIASFQAKLSDGIDFEKFTNDVTGLDVTAVARWNLNDSFTLMGRAGLMRWDSEFSYKSSFGGNDSISESGTSLLYGVGAEFKMFSLSYEVIKDVGDDDTMGEGDIERISLGAKITF